MRPLTRRAHLANTPSPTCAAAYPGALGAAWIRTLEFRHLRFEALLTAASDFANPCGFALVAVLGLLGLRIFEATGGDIEDLGEEHGHRLPQVCEGTKVVLVPLPSAVGRAIDRACSPRAESDPTIDSRIKRVDLRTAVSQLLPALPGESGRVGRVVSLSIRSGLVGNVSC